MSGVGKAAAPVTNVATAPSEKINSSGTVKRTKAAKSFSFCSVTEVKNTSAAEKRAGSVSSPFTGNVTVINGKYHVRKALAGSVTLENCEGIHFGNTTTYTADSKKISSYRSASGTKIRQSDKNNLNSSTSREKSAKDEKKIKKDDKGNILIAGVRGIHIGTSSTFSTLTKKK